MPTTDPQRDWEGGWQQLDLTVDNDVWLVTERIKLKYLAPLLRPSTGLLEHFADPTQLIRALIRVLKPGGPFFSDVVPLKFSLARSVWYLRGLHKTVDDEHAYGRDDIERWMLACGLEDRRVFSSAVVPPLGLLARLPGGAALSRLGDPLWTSLDGTALGDALGFFYLAFGRVPGRHAGP